MQKAVSPVTVSTSRPSKMVFGGADAVPGFCSRPRDAIAANSSALCLMGSMVPAPTCGSRCPAIRGIHRSCPTRGWSLSGSTALWLRAAPPGVRHRPDTMRSSFAFLGCSRSRPWPRQPERAGASPMAMALSAEDALILGLGHGCGAERHDGGPDSAAKPRWQPRRATEQRAELGQGVCSRPACRRPFQPRRSGGRAQAFCTPRCRREFENESRRAARAQAKRRARRRLQAASWGRACDVASGRPVLVARPRWLLDFGLIRSSPSPQRLWCRFR